MIPRTLDLKRLKQTVTIEQVLSDEGLLDRFHRRGPRLVGPCPLHGGDNPTAFTVDLDRNIWH
jgi:DNA primase